MIQAKHIRHAFKKVSLEYPLMIGYTTIYPSVVCVSYKDGFGFSTDKGEVWITNQELETVLKDIPDFKKLDKYQLVNGKLVERREWEYDLMYEWAIMRLMYDYISKKANQE